MARDQHVVNKDGQQSLAQKIPLHHPGRPRLIVLEGIDLSGRTTQVQLLQDWLTAERYNVTTTAWRTSPLISDVLLRARIGPPLRPLTYSMLYAADHIERTQRVIKPALARGEIVLADRYTYTAFARDSARGFDPAWIENLYRYSVQPDVVFYLHISPEEAVKRRLALQQQRLDVASSAAKEKVKQEAKLEGKHGKPAKDEKGKHQKHHHRQQEKMSIQLQPPVARSVASKVPVLTAETLESFHDFEMKMYRQYQQMRDTFGFTVIEGNQSIHQVQAALRRAVMQLISDMP
jgi:dTMP kinase